MFHPLLPCRGGQNPLLTYAASSWVSGQLFPEWPSSPQTSHDVCEFTAWMVPMLEFATCPSIFCSSKSIFVASTSASFADCEPFLCFPSFSPALICLSCLLARADSETFIGGLLCTEPTSYCAPVILFKK